LYGYGSYGSSSDPSFSSNRLSLLDRGFVYAIAHIRGGQEMGRYWYDQGKLLQKKNTFTDFIACAEHLIAEKYTSSDRLVIHGASAGGLLMGAVTNMRPDLFKAVVAKVPFVDVINTMLDATIPLTVTEYEEWGDPRDREYYDYIKSYSPYDNVEAGDYPNILVTAGLNDPRVQYWEPAKWIAKLRAMKTDKNLLLLKTNMGAGHGGASGRYDYLKEIAFEYAFIFDRLGINGF
jgi:oligopeptidase B